MSSVQLAGGIATRTRDSAPGLHPPAAIEKRLADRTQPLSVDAPPDLIVFSIDQFPDIRKSFGEYMWQQAVSVVTRLICAAVRPRDIAIRHGEHQFVVLLEEGSVRAVDHVTAEVRSAIAKLNSDGVLPMALTISA